MASSHRFASTRHEETASKINLILICINLVRRPTPKQIPYISISVVENRFLLSNLDLHQFVADRCMNNP